MDIGLWSSPTQATLQRFVAREQEPEVSCFWRFADQVLMLGAQKSVPALSIEPRAEVGGFASKAIDRREGFWELRLRSSREDFWVPIAYLDTAVTSVGPVRREDF